MGGFASSKILEVHGERMIKRTFDPGFRIELHQKDLNLALASARALGVVAAEHRHGAGAVQRLRRPRRQGLGPLGAWSGRWRRWPTSRSARQADGSKTAHGRTSRARCCARMFDAAIAAAQPALVHAAASAVAAARPQLVVIGAGKAVGRHGASRRATTGAGAARRAWSSPATATRVPCERIEIVEAAHPVPDAAGRLRPQRMLADGQQGLTRRRPRALPDLRRRLVAAAAAAPRA